MFIFTPQKILKWFLSPSVRQPYLGVGSNGFPTIKLFHQEGQNRVGAT